MIEINIIRRTIIIVCLLILGLSWVNSFPESKYYDDNLKALVKEGKAQVIEVGKGLKLDHDTFYIKRIINTKDKTYIRFSYLVKESGWTFPDSSIKITDDKGKVLQNHGAGASGKMWGQEGLMSFDRISEDTKQIIISLEWFDRRDEMIVFLDKAGEASED